jgi:hypothetical protein
MTGLHHGARQQLLVSLKRSDSLLVTKCSWPPTSFRPHAKSPVHLSCKKVLRLKLVKKVRRIRKSVEKQAALIEADPYIGTTIEMPMVTLALALRDVE